MGRKKKLRTQRLPVSERTLVGSKVSTRAISSPASVDESAARGGGSKRVVFKSDLSELSCNIETTLRFGETRREPVNVVAVRSVPGGVSNLVELDDDVLRRIFRDAGVLALLSATRVNRTWRRVALEELRGTTRLNLTDAVRRAGITLSPSYEWFPRTIHAFPNLQILSLAQFPYPELLPELAPYVLERLESGTLRTLDLSGLDFAAVDIRSLITSNRVPYLETLILEQCDAVNGELTRQLGDALVTTKRRLKVVNMSKCGHLDAEALGPLLTRNAVDSVIVKKCSNVRRITSTKAVTSRELVLHDCHNLGRFHVVAAAGALVSLNLSQNKSLASVQLVPKQGSVLGVRTLNLAMCSSLRSISFGLDVCGLPHVEELLLSRARNIPLHVFERTLGLSSASCVMPHLRILKLIDTQVRELRLIGYACLEEVNASGCGDLNRIEIRDTPKLEMVRLVSRKAPLSMVRLDVPRKTQIVEKRPEWIWQQVGTRQVVEYGLGGGGAV